MKVTHINRKGSTLYLDAVVELSLPEREGPLSVFFCFGEMGTPAFVHFYEEAKKGEKEAVLVQVHLSQPLPLKWKDGFILKTPDRKEIWGKGKVLDPFSEKITRRREKRRLEFLTQLLGNEKEMLFALTQFKGIQGLWEKEVILFGSLPKRRLLGLSQGLEAQEKIRILSFSPLFLISQSSFLFLGREILSHLKRFHEKHPDRVGIPREKIRKRFDLHPRILSLTLRHLMQEGRIKDTDDQVALADFEMALLPEEEKILDRLEDMCLKGEFQSVSLEGLRKSFRLTSERLHKMLSLLMERKKIVLSKDGFILHSHWLDEIIEKIRKSGKKELTVTDFKKMTGLSRKYAIPLLELLDQLGITRRRGPFREIH